MSKEMRKLVTIFSLVALITAAGGTAQANWSADFEDDAPDWEYHCFPDVTQTFSHTIKTDPNGNKYLSLDETTSYDTDAGSYGSAFAAGFGPQEDFTDVRMGAVFNVTGDASRNYCGFSARTTYIIDDGSVSGAPGMFATQTYVMHINWEDGPADLRIDLEKVVNMQNIMQNSVELGLEIAVPGLNHARSYYAEMDIVGSGPVYITGSLYEYKGGPLVARTATMVDTNGNDPWEEEVDQDAVFTSGKSAIFAQNEQEEPAGYHCTFDDVFSVSDGPAAVNPGPVDGATGVPVNAALSWIEAEFATGRELWIGKPGQMQKVAPAPAGTTHTVGPLEFGQTYQWRIDQVGPSGPVTGHTWSFTTAECLNVEDFESYTGDADIRTEWVDNITEPGVEYVSLVTGENQSLLFEYQNQFEPYCTEATRTFAGPQDWTAQGVKAVALSFYGERDNVEQPMYVKLEDSSGNAWKVENPYTHSCQAERWEDWRVALSEFSDNGVDVSSVKKVTVGTGNGTKSAQSEADADKDFVYIDDIRLCPAGCYNVDQLNLRGDVNGDCKIDLNDLAVMAAGWLNDGSSAAP